jgi:hypothetical protein
MLDVKSSTAAFMGNLVRVRSMAVTSAVVLGCTFLPMAGGTPKPYEVREFTAGIGALLNGRTSTPSVGRVVHPDWGGVQLTSAVDESVRMTSAALAPEAAPAEFETLAGDGLLEAEIMPVVQIVEGPADACAEDDCAIEAPVPEEVVIEAPELEAIEEIAPLEIG